MFNILGIDHIVLRTKDVNGMLAFYTEVLGCPLERQLTEFGLFQLRAGKSLIDLVDVDGPIGKSGGEAPGNEARNVDHFCLRIDPFEPTAIFRHLDQHKVTHSEAEERYGAEGNGLSIYISDPEGNTVELKGPASN
jgi:glyoxylase I family protein